MITTQNINLQSAPTAPTQVRHLLDLFSAYLQALNRRPNTIKNHMVSLEQLDAFLQQDSHTLTGACRADIYAFLFQNSDSSPSVVRGIHRRMSCIRSFYRFLIFLGKLTVNPTAGIALPKLPATLPRDVLTISEAARLLKTPAARTAEGILDRALLEILYSTGLRVRELCNLTMNDIDYCQRQLTVRNGKGGKDRVVPVGRRALDLVKLYTSRYQSSAPPDPSSPLFVTLSGHPVRPSSIQYMLRLYSSRAVPDKRITPHTMRHSCATHLIMNGASVSHVQHILGHKDISTTQIYVRLAPCELKRVYCKHHPMATQPGTIHLRPPVRDLDTTAFPTPPLLLSSETPSHINKEQSIPKELADYWQHLNSLNRSERAIRTQIARIKRFLIFARSHDSNAPGNITPDSIIAYQCYVSQLRNQHGNPISIAVRNQYMSAVSCFAQYLHMKDVLATNPMQGFVMARQPSKMPHRVPNEKEMKLILAEPDTASIMGLRDRTIMETLYATGVRKQELINLSLEEIDFENGFLTVRCGKGQQDRVVPIARRVLRFISFFVKHARHHFLAPDMPPAPQLFLSVHGRLLSKNSLGHIVGKHAASAGIPFRITPHSFRHAFATHQVRKGANIRHIQEMLGHTKLSTTQIYIQLTIEDLKKAHRRYHPSEQRWTRKNRSKR